MTTETRSFKLDSWALPAVREELALRVRLRSTVMEPPWWRFWADPVVIVTGPTAALDAAAEAIRQLELDAWAAKQW